MKIRNTSESDNYKNALSVRMTTCKPQSSINENLPKTKHVRLKTEESTT